MKHWSVFIILIKTSVFKLGQAPEPLFKQGRSNRSSVLGESLRRYWIFTLSQMDMLYLENFYAQQLHWTYDALKACYQTLVNWCCTILQHEKCPSTHCQYNQAQNWGIWGNKRVFSVCLQSSPYTIRVTTYRSHGSFSAQMEARKCGWHWKRVQRVYFISKPFKCYKRGNGILIQRCPTKKERVSGRESKVLTFFPWEKPRVNLSLWCSPVVKIYC